MEFTNHRQAIKNNYELCSTIAIEECCELIQAITKAKRGKLNKDNLAEEIADVLICLDWIQDIYEITDIEIFKHLNIKKERIVDRLNSGTFK